MNTKTKNIIFSISLIAMLMITIGSFVYNDATYIGNIHVPGKVRANMKIETERLVNGQVVYSTYEQGNQIQDLGNYYISNLTCARALAGSTGWVYANNGTVYIALGNHTTLSVYTATKLDSELAVTDTGFKRTAALTPTYASGSGIGNGNHYNFTITNKFTATVADNINATSIQWSGVAQSDNNMFAVAAITATSFAIGDNCTITWTITTQK